MFIFILLCLIFSWFLVLFIYIINIRYWQIRFITQEQLGKSCSASSTFKCCRSTTAVPVLHVPIVISFLLESMPAYFKEVYSLKEHFFYSSQKYLICFLVLDYIFSKVRFKVFCYLWRSRGLKTVNLDIPNFNIQQMSDQSWFVIQIKLI